MSLVRDVMEDHPCAIPADQTLRAAAQLMRDHDCGFLPVMNGGTVSGVVTDRDLAIRGIADGQDPATIPVARVMTPDPVAVSPDIPLGDAAEVMAGAGVRRLVVIDDGRLAGVLSFGRLEQELGGKGREARDALLAVTEGA